MVILTALLEQFHLVFPQTDGWLTRNNEGEWFKALLATGGCSSLLTLFLLLLPYSFWVFWSFSILMFFFPFSIILVDVSCNEGKHSSLHKHFQSTQALSCLAFWYDMLCFALFCFSLIFCCLFCYSPVCFSLFCLYLIEILLIWMEKLNCKCSNGVLPSAIPLGHSILSETRTCRSTPFIPAFSILACVPQSDQYMNLRGSKQTKCSESESWTDLKVLNLFDFTYDTIICPVCYLLDGD